MICSCSYLNKQQRQDPLKVQGRMKAQRLEKQDCQFEGPTDKDSRLCVDSDMISLKSKEKRAPKIFHVHRALLCFYSPYHDRLLNGSFLEATSPPTEPLLIEADANVLKLFVSWLYTGEFHMIRQHLFQDDDDDDDKWYIGITKLYILADWLNCTALERLIVTAQQDRLMGSRWNLPTWRSIDLLSHSSLESSGLYQYYLTVYDQHWDGHVGDQTHPDGQSIPATLSEDPMPPHFAYRVLLMKLRTAQNNKGEEKDCQCCRDRCKFHRHESEEERKATCGSPNDETEDDEDAISDFDSEVDSESESESDTNSDADTCAEPTTKKRVREGEDNEGAKAERMKAD
ncbi:hypothetical protein D6D19_07765 [Aureobasidium pullulans]|uniref:BTB domain-containing protein n=1 Tax=Aureobasidium pullulans TaxID=5580 RepID=A0A4V4IQM7_AURPU|nr:hypothetical protein D6D19_07765 [Aureobasidium pullulans]